MTIDQALRFLTLACFAAALWLIWLVAPLYAPRLSDGDTKAFLRCLELNGVPVFNDYGAVKGCNWR